MDVLLGHRALGMSRPQLHVHLGIPGGRLVRKRRVAQVVEWPEGPVDPGAPERRAEVLPGEPARIQRPARVRVTEDEIVVARVRGGLPVLREQLLGSAPELDEPEGHRNHRSARRPVRS